MLVRFATKRLEKCYREVAVARREWGERVARMYVQRINTLHAARDARDLFALRALDCHPLKGERKGQYAIRLGDRERLIVAFADTELTVVRIEEVSRHNGD
ncbi:MAG: type II toxin-antitoxin system RelE/ParE family toxin [Deltaproteobacteria bacterium]|nr:type II toxin-antitoxin system RelE/ParE family toxin [Deltaproteobacteria bacterium]